MLVGFILVGGLLTTLSEDKPSLDRAHLWLFLGASLGFAAVTLGFQLPNIVAGRVYKNHGRMRVLIGSVVIAAVCVFVTRLLKLEPPYLYGLIAVYVFETELVGRVAGRLTAAAAGLVLCISLAAWAVDAPLHATVAGEVSPSPLLLVVDAACSRSSRPVSDSSLSASFRSHSYPGGTSSPGTASLGCSCSDAGCSALSRCFSPPIAATSPRCLGVTPSRPSEPSPALHSSLWRS